MTITDKQSLREFYGEPGERAVKKEMRKLDVHCRNFIAASPFCVLSTAGADGRADASPKGDPPGFVAVLDDTTLLIPDRLGNNRVDSMQNILENPHVGLLFMVPGRCETLRVNGRARITTEAELLAPLAVQGKAPKAGLVVEIEEVFLHCAKSLVRSKLWEPESQLPGANLPSVGRMMGDQIEGLDPDESERMSEESVRTNLY